MKRRQVEADLKQISFDSNKRQKISNAIASNAIDSASNSSAKCTPLSPLPEQPPHEQLETISGGKKLQSIGHYQLLAPLEENAQTFTAIDTRCEGRLVICRRLDRSKYTHLMQLAHRLSLTGNNWEDDDENRRAYEQIFPATSELIAGSDGHFYFFEPKNFGSLHAHVVERKRLNERDCLWYARQIVHLVAFCHKRRVVLRDLKLRKFVFADAEHLTIRLDGLDELFVCPDDQDDEDEDKISDRHGCPAYVGPEILDLNQKSFSGRAADMWSLGVLLFVILYGRYPFYDTTPARLFAKIRHGNIHMMEEAGISFEARSFIRCLLRRDPSERPSAMDILAHPWLQSGDRVKSASTRRPYSMGSIAYAASNGYRLKDLDNDQCVPCVDQNKKVDKKIDNGGRRLNEIDQPAVPNQ
jgi:tribbles-like protein